ncbi:NAD(P)H-dependent flavin oxidoreductase [Thermodesulfobacteriota bacterium]
MFNKLLEDSVMWKTKITELFGIKYPIVEGAYAGFGTSALAAPVSEAGGLGFITAGTLKTPEKLREDIRKAKSMTDKPLGVNLTVMMCDEIDKMREVSIEEGIPIIETAGFRADEHGERIKEAGVKWIHKVSTVKHAIAAEKQGADAVHIVGLEGIGFKNIAQLPTLITAIETARRIKSPLIIGGGIGNSRGFLAAMSMGADAVGLGTALMATEECPISDRVKQKILETNIEDPKVRRRCLTPPDSKEYEKVMKKRGQIPTSQWLRELELVMIKEPGEIVENIPGYEFEDEVILRTGISLAACFVDRVLTVKEFISNMVEEAEDIIKSGRIGWVPDQ